MIISKPEKNKLINGLSVGLCQLNPSSIPSFNRQALNFIVFVGVHVYVSSGTLLLQCVWRTKETLVNPGTELRSLDLPDGTSTHWHISQA